MATRKQTSSSSKRSATTTHAATTAATGRYPQWKVELFRAGISERRQSASGQMGGRAARAPGA